MTTKILVPLDGSETALTTLNWAVNAFPQGQFQLLHVINKSHPQMVVEAYQTEEAHAALNAGKGVIASANATLASSEFVEAGPVEGIIEYAKDKKPDLLLLGSHGKTGLNKVLMGSVSEKVLADSPVPTLIYKNIS